MKLQVEISGSGCGPLLTVRATGLAAGWRAGEGGLLPPVSKLCRCKVDGGPIAASGCDAIGVLLIAKAPGASPSPSSPPSSLAPSPSSPSPSSPPSSSSFSFSRDL